MEGPLWKDDSWAGNQKSCERIPQRSRGRSFQVERTARAKVLRLEGQWLHVETDCRWATVVGRGSAGGCCRSPEGRWWGLGPGWCWWRRWGGVSFGISSIIRGFHPVREAKADVPEEATLALRSEGWVEVARWRRVRALWGQVKTEVLIEDLGA